MKKGFKQKMSDYPKVITMYLPQFYETKENNQWWGEGFTEWSAVKAGKPLFENHYNGLIN